MGAPHVPNPGRTGRFAPSPTGDLHVGNLRTALVAWMFARSQGARFLLRIDDLDPDRSRPEHARRQLADLAAIGLDWDAPALVQSDRSSAHEAALNQLEAAGHTYPCFCSRAEVRAAASAPNAPLEAGGGYPGTCRDMPAAEVRRRTDAGEPSCVRIRGGIELAFDDRILGEVTGVVDDLVVRRRDGVPAYNVACVVDDSFQEVGEVVRGDDLATSTPAQIYMAQLLGLPIPTYAHVPIVVAPDGTRLAKRHGSVTFADLVPHRMSAVELVHMLLATVGFEAGRGELDLRDLAVQFDPVNVSHAPLIFDPVAARFSSSNS